MIVPYRAYVNLEKPPITNILIIGVTVVFFLILFESSHLSAGFESMILSGWELEGKRKRSEKMV